MAKTTKDFSNNPAMQFLSSGKMDEPETKSKAPVKGKSTSSKKDSGASKGIKGVKIMVEPKPETKSKQIHLLLTPSNLEKLKTLSTQAGRSVNDYLNCIIDQL